MLVIHLIHESSQRLMAFQMALQMSKSDRNDSDADRKADINDTHAKVVAPIAWKISPVTNVAVFEALPPAAKDRETKKAADMFASTGRNVFVHYVTPILRKRRELLITSGLTKKKYPRTAAQLWSALPLDESFFWNEAAMELRQCMKQNILSPKGCLVHAGRLSEREAYLWHAEVAVAAYLNLPHPENSVDTSAAGEKHHDDETAKDDVKISTGTSLEKLRFATTDTSTIDSAERADSLSSFSTRAIVDIVVQTHISEDSSASNSDQSYEEDTNDDKLLDTLPDRFEYEQNMLYSHFAHYDYNKIRKAEGKHQTAILRQLADRFDKTGKILFYYYVVPRLCKEIWPPSKGETVTGKAAELWRFLPGRGKEKWFDASSKLKKQLGDGDIAGLETLQLDSLDPEVLRLHGLAQVAIQEHGKKN